MMDPYMAKTEALLCASKMRLDRLSLSLRSPAPGFSELARQRKLKHLEARYAEVSRRFLQLSLAGSQGVADLKVGLEKALDRFRSELGWTS
jgi:hypothetical protein